MRDSLGHFSILCHFKNYCKILSQSKIRSGLYYLSVFGDEPLDSSCKCHTIY